MHLTHTGIIAPRTAAVAARHGLVSNLREPARWACHALGLPGLRLIVAATAQVTLSRACQAEFTRGAP